jgi:hypothetical protein
MEIVSVANGYESIFWSYVNRDSVNCYFLYWIGLNVDETEEMASLMRRCDPEWWGEITAEKLKQRWHKVF